MISRDYDLTTRKNSSLCKLFTISNVPTYMGIAPEGQTPENDIVADMTWHVAEGSGMVQLHPLVPLQYVYQQQHNAVVGATWLEHHDKFAALIAKHSPRHVVEIGGGHGYLAMKLLFTDAVKKWTMVDPNPLAVFPMPSLTIVRKYIEDMTFLPEGVDAVVHSHALEHIYDPWLFFARLRNIMVVGGLHIFSVPNLYELARQDAPCLHFEHTLLLREEWVDGLLVAHGFELVEKVPFGGIHSIFYVARLARKVADEPAHRSRPVRFVDSGAVAQRWYRHLTNDAQAATLQLSTNISLNFLFAAHAGSQYLLAVGMPEQRFASILDNNPNKVGRRLYGSRLWVQAPSAIAGLPSPRIVLRQGAYNSEISAQLLAINPSSVIVKLGGGAERLPEPARIDHGADQRGSSGAHTRCRERQRGCTAASAKKCV